MRINPVIDLAKLLELKNLTPNLIKEAWEIHNILYVFTWITFFSLEKDATKFTIEMGWDPDSTLVLYTMPMDNPEGVSVDEQTIINELSMPSLVNKAQCTCQFFKDMTLQGLANKINQVKNMRAFL